MYIVLVWRPGTLRGTAGVHRKAWTGVMTEQKDDGDVVGGRGEAEHSLSPSRTARKFAARVTSD